MTDLFGDKEKRPLTAVSRCALAVLVRVNGCV
jgi:hypothetical protein